MRLIATLILLLITNSIAVAVEKNEGWIFTPSIGINKLALKSFYNTVYTAPFKGSVEITTDLAEDVEGQNQYPIESFIFQNDLKKNDFDIEAGLEMRRSFGVSNDFFIGINAWETNSDAEPIKVTFPLQGDRYNRAIYARSGKLRYTQFFVGARHYLTKRKSKLNAYFNVSIHELYDVRYEERNVFDFIAGAPKGFKRIFIFKANATSVLMFQLGAGAEYRIAERFSLGIEGAYSIQFKDGTLKNVSVSDDSNEGDRIKTEPAVITALQPTLEAAALNADGVSYNKVRLRFDGWHLLAKFNIQFF